ncbi:MAG: tyrosine-type recombinase/integrase [bacterium]|nr:tyrosine-type recombinase/integrase [bacterium]
MNIQDYLNYLKNEKKSSQKTVNNYNYYLTRFFNFCNISSSSDINTDKIDNFKKYLSQIRNNKKELTQISTQNYHLIALRSYLDYLKLKGVILLNSKEVKLNKQKTKEKNILSENEVDKLLEAPLLTKNPGVIQKRDKAILEILLCSGIKVSELSKLKKANVNFHSNTINIIHQKKSRALNLSNQAVFSLKDYLDLRQDNINALFIRHDKAKDKQLNSISKDNYQLTPRTIQRIIKKYAKKTNLGDDITPEKLRQAYALHLKKKGYNEKTIQSMLGHESIITTKLYTRQ